ncbi:MAG TPA: hypothetical protein VKX25_09420 [Bryobacteraceae bacterium]|jgi:hypothetical protein|nr:hypothetical protein [Bryobacteraceae bacterium]
MLEVAKAVGLPLEDFHFRVETFGDGVLTSEAPPAGDFVAPGMPGMAELNQWREAATAEGSDIGQKAPCLIAL